MCLICIDLNRRALRPEEARRALSEMRDNLDADHVREIETLIEQADSEQTVPNHKP